MSTRNQHKAPWTLEHTVDSFWLRDAEFFTDPIQPVLNAQSYSTDVLVIGGGFTGMSTAWHLSQLDPGLKITLVDATRCGFGSSGRNVGWCMTQNLSTPSYSPEFSQSAHDLMKEGAAIIKSLVEEHGVDCDMIPSTIFDVCAKEKPGKYYKTMRASCAQLGIKTDWYDKEATQKRFKSTLLTGALAYHDGSMCLHPGKLVRSMRKLVLESGVQVFEGTPITKLDFSSAKPRAQTEFGAITADRVVIATNAYSRSYGEFKDKYMPIHSSMITTEQLSDLQLDSIGFKRSEMIALSGEDNMSLFAAVSPDNRIVIGGGGKPLHYYNSKFPAGVNKDQVDLVIDYLTKKVWPQLDGVNIDHKWGGMVAVSREMVVGIGTHSKNENVFYAVGYSGEGVSTTFASGKTIAQIMCGMDTSLTQSVLVNRKMGWIPGDPVRSLALKILF